MTKNIPDLWPDDLTVPTLIAPVAILRQQALLLSEKTQNLIQAEVLPSTQPVRVYKPGETRTEEHFLYQFHLMAPTLDNYRFFLFYIIHGADFYPITIHSEIDSSDIEVKSEQEFIEALRKFFASERVKRVIQALIAQSQA